jgi:hypothetical protein
MRQAPARTKAMTTVSCFPPELQYQDLFSAKNAKDAKRSKKSAFYFAFFASFADKLLSHHGA